MAGQYTLVFLAVVGLVVVVVSGWKDWLKFKQIEHGQQALIALSKQETERLKTVVDAMQQQ